MEVDDLPIEAFRSPGMFSAVPGSFWTITSPSSPSSSTRYEDRHRSSSERVLASGDTRHDYSTKCRSNDIPKSRSALELLSRAGKRWIGRRHDDTRQ